MQISAQLCCLPARLCASMRGSAADQQQLPAHDKRLHPSLFLMQLLDSFRLVRWLRAQFEFQIDRKLLPGWQAGNVTRTVGRAAVTLIQASDVQEPFSPSCFRPAAEFQRCLAIFPFSDSFSEITASRLREAFFERYGVIRKEG